MALVDSDAGIIVTAAPGTASTALREALFVLRQVREVPSAAEARAAGVDAKHATVTQLIAAGVIEPDHGLRVVTTTRNPFDFYVAEYQRSRTRWVHELRSPESWLYATPGAVDQVVDAVTLSFEDWLVAAIGEAGEPRRVNRGHLDEADVVLRMEHLEADLYDLLDLELTVLRTNVTDRPRAYWQAYDVPSRRLVERAHAEDLERFGYAF